MESRNREPFPFEPASVDVLLVTYAHIDHTGMIPRLVRQGFHGPIFCTRATADLCQVMLRDSAHIQEMTVAWQNRRRKRNGLEPLEPLYDMADVERSLELFQGVDYEESFRPFQDEPSLRVRLRDAGHILGSAIVEVTEGVNGTSRKVVFSGDLGNAPAPILKDPTPLEEADYVLIESTYGYRQHEDSSEKNELLAEAVRRALEQGGNLVIPCFAVGRTQEILHALHQLEGEGRIPRLPVFVDSPMAINATEIFQKHRECYDAQMLELLAEGDSPFRLPNLRLTRTAAESRAINEARGSSIIISASGMCTAGRILHHLKHNLWRPESTILFVGYQAVGTTGRSIRDGARQVRIMGEKVRVKASVLSIGGFSAHADRNSLLDWLQSSRNRPEKVFVVHGEPRASIALQDAINESWPGVAIVPTYGQRVLLEAASVGALLPAPGTEMAPEALVSRISDRRDALSGRTARLSEEVRDFVKVIQDWSEEEEDRSKAARATGGLVQEAMAHLGRLACDSADALKSLVDTLAREGALEARQGELLEELEQLGERLSGETGPE